MKERIISVFLIFAMCLCVGCHSSEPRSAAQAALAEPTTEPTTVQSVSPQIANTAAPEIADTAAVHGNKSEQPTIETPPAQNETVQSVEALDQTQDDEAIEYEMQTEQGDASMKITFNALPKTSEQFTALADGKLTSPESTCALFLLALNMYTQDKDAGLEAINLLRGPRPMTGYDSQFIRDRLRDKAYLPLAYFDGATPDNSYMPTEPYTVNVYPDPRPQDCEAGYMRLFLKTTGADSTRPIKLRQKGDEWFLWEYSSILSGIRIPASQDPWA